MQFKILVQGVLHKIVLQIKTIYVCGAKNSLLAWLMFYQTYQFLTCLVKTLGQYNIGGLWVIVAKLYVLDSKCQEITLGDMIYSFQSCKTFFFNFQ